MPGGASAAGMQGGLGLDLLAAVRAAGGAGLVLLQAEGADGHGLLGGLLGCGPVMEVNTNSPAVFVNRGGRIPAPLQSLKN